MILLIFTLVLLLANIYFFYKKQYLYFFIPCMLFLPQYYGVEISESLPIITVTRIMFLIFYIYVFINRKQNLSLLTNIKKLPKYYLLLAGYFIFRITSNLYYVTTYGQALKTISIIIFEQLFLLLAIYMLAPSENEIIILIKSVVYSATAFYCLGIFESLSFFRLFDHLYTVDRYMLNDYYIRLGLLRATTSMGLPGLYSNMCLLTLVLTLYLYNEEKAPKYICIIALCILATIHSGSRSNIFFAIIIFIIYLLLIERNKDRFLKLSKNLVIIVLLCSSFIGVLSISDKKYSYYYITTGKSVLNEVGFDFDLNAGKPSNSEGFGQNANGTYSRTSQLSGIKYALSVNPIFGQGSGVQNRNEIKYFFHGKWLNFHTIDMGIVEIIVSEGLLGLLGYLSIIAFVITNLVKRKLLSLKYSDKTLLYFLYGCAYLLTTLSTVNMQAFLILYVILVIYMPETPSSTN